jgi:ATP-binding cassette subfamily B protein
MNRISIRERIELPKRGFKIINRYCPGMVRTGVLAEAVSAIQPFVSVWISAQIINELSGLRRVETVVLYVAGIVLFNFACYVLKTALKEIYRKKESEMWRSFEKMFADKQMSMDFPDIESAEIQHQHKKLYEHFFMFGYGLPQLVVSTPLLVRVFVNITTSVAMTVSLFVSKTGNALMDNPIWIAILLFFIVLSGYGNYKAVNKTDLLFEKSSRNRAYSNRTFDFFTLRLSPKPEKAMDVRIYDQSGIAEKTLKKFSVFMGGKEEDKYDFLGTLYPALSTLLVGVSNIVCYLFVVVKAFFGAFGIGNIVQYVSVLSKFGDGIRELWAMLSDNTLYCRHLKRTFEYLDIPNKMYQGSLTVEKRDDNEYYVEFKDVSFKYPNTDIYALHHVNVKFKVGEKLAVVGMNGSGKTTFIKLLCRLYDPTEGEILLNGVNIKKYDYQEYMSIFSVVFQDFQLFSFSLGQNVAASAEYDREKVVACLEKAGFGERLEAMPKGVETSLYKNFDLDGVEISGGEAQKIALARALYKDAPFIILDEPTAALDPVSEYEVYSKFDEIAGDRTAVYISHRLASCRFCDKIAVFHQGAIIQTGSHEELLTDSGGKYYELWNAQAQYYTV